MRRGGNDGASAKAPGLDVFIENLPGNVYRRVRSPDGAYRFEFLSRGLFRQFGIDNERLLAESRVRFDWIHPDDRVRFVADLELSAATLGLLDHRVRVVGQDGRVFWARGIARPSRRPDGSVVWDGIVIDVTREVEAEAAMRLAKAEADRAQATATRTVTEFVERVGGPAAALRNLAHRLAESGAPVEGPLAAELIGYCEELEGALAGRPAESGPAQRRQPAPAGLSTLTGRQKEVFRLVAQGMTNKAIAQRLGISPGTVKLHVAAVLRATGTRTRRQLGQVARA